MLVKWTTEENFNKMNDELNKEGTSDSLEDEPASLRVENEVNDDNKVDTVLKKKLSQKKNKMAINYGIVSSILIISSILTFFVTENF